MGRSLLAKFLIIPAQMKESVSFPPARHAIFFERRHWKPAHHGPLPHNDPIDGGNSMARKFRIFIIALTMVLVGAESAQAGFFSRLMDLERRKNEWLRSVFLRR
jgi:hypothetical protein